MGPLKAARIDMKFPTSTLALLMPHLIPNSRTQRQWQVSKATLFSSEVGRPMSAGPSRNDFSCAWWLKSAFRRWATAGNVKLLLPPRQSRGASLGRLVLKLRRCLPLYSLRPKARPGPWLTECRSYGWAAGSPPRPAGQFPSPSRCAEHARSAPQSPHEGGDASRRSEPPRSQRFPP